MKFKKNIPFGRKQRGTGRKIEHTKPDEPQDARRFITAIKSFLDIFPAGIQILIAFSVVCAIAFTAMKLSPEPRDMDADCQKFCHPRFSRLVHIFPEVMNQRTRTSGSNLKQCECY